MSILLVKIGNKLENMMIGIVFFLIDFWAKQKCFCNFWSHGPEWNEQRKSHSY
jgi:hypothetical protein